MPENIVQHQGLPVFVSKTAISHNRPISLSKPDNVELLASGGDLLWEPSMAEHAEHMAGVVAK